MQLSDITVFRKGFTTQYNEDGHRRRGIMKVLNSLSTPVGRKFCQTYRYSKNRELSEKWREIRDKWVNVLNQIDPDITADNLPWDNGRYLSPFFPCCSKHSNQMVRFFIKEEDAVNAMNAYSNSMCRGKGSFVYWDVERQDFGAPLTTILTPKIGCPHFQGHASL